MYNYTINFPLVYFVSLRKLLKMDHVGEYIDEYQISGQNIMDNMECTEKQGNSARFIFG